MPEPPRAPSKGFLRALLRQGLLRAIGPVGEAFLPVLERYTWFVPMSGLLSLLSSGLEGFGIGLLIPLLSEVLGRATGHAVGVMGIFARISGAFPTPWRMLGVTACIFAAILLKAALQTLYW